MGCRSRAVTGTVSFRPGAAVAALGRAALRTRDRAAAVRHDAARTGGPETYGSRYVFGFIDRSTVSTRFRMGYTVKPDMNLDVYAEPFAASGHYYDYGELLAPRSRERLRLRHQRHDARHRIRTAARR